MKYPCVTCRNSNEAATLTSDTCGTCLGTEDMLEYKPSLAKEYIESEEDNESL